MKGSRKHVRKVQERRDSTQEILNFMPTLKYVSFVFPRLGGVKVSRAV